MSILAFGSPKHLFVTKVMIGFIIVPSTIAFYATYLWIFPKYLKLAKWKKALSTSLANWGISAFSGFILLVFVLQVTSWETATQSTVVGVILFLIVIAMVNSIMAWVIKGFVTWFEEQNLKRKLSEEKRNLELAFLKSKMDPHFVFNSLNNIDTLVQDDPKTGSEYLNKLSDVLRFMLFESQKDLIELDKEIEYLNSYINLQRIRSTNPDFVRFDVIGSTQGKSIAPVILIPIVENAFKHSGSKKESNAIDIQLNISQGAIAFNCSNTIGSSVEKQGDLPSLGNSLLRRRLDLIYAQNYSLRTQQDKNRYHVFLTINV